MKASGAFCMQMQNKSRSRKGKRIANKHHLQRGLPCRYEEITGGQHRAQLYRSAVWNDKLRTGQKDIAAGILEAE